MIHAKSFCCVLVGTLVIFGLYPAQVLALDNSVGPNGINAAVLHSAVTGVGPVRVGVLDIGQIGTSPYLRVHGNGGSGDVSEHATLVAGVINSSHPTYTGVAPGAFLYGYGVETLEDNFNGANWLADQGVTIIEHSFGWTGYDETDLDGSSLPTRYIDFMAGNSNILFAVSGNQGESDYPPIPTDTFNGIVVNATVMGASGRYDRVAAWNNYTEPPLDGRCKPDLVAPGGSIYTTTIGTGFEDVDGTSFAAPHVAGVAALLSERSWRNGLSADHNVFRSVMINSADKTTMDTSGDNWLASEAYSDTSIPLDDELGAGQLDAAAADAQYIAGEHEHGNVPTVGWDLNTISGEGTDIRYSFEDELLAGSYLTATLVWDRRVILEDDQDNDGQFDYDEDNNEWLTAFDANDLDINLYGANGELLTGSWSGEDNVEHLHWLVPDDGAYQLGVEFYGINDLATQEYAFAWSVSEAPEPATMGLLALGGLALLKRRRK